MRILPEPPSSRCLGRSVSLSAALGSAKASGGRPGWTNRRRAGRIGKGPLNLDSKRVMKRVLVVDDDDSLRQLVAEALREASYRVDLAANGAEALRLMRGRLPHAIVLDLMMPQLDGSGFVELMRLNPRFAAVPVLLV